MNKNGDLRQKVFATADQLKAEGRKISARAILYETGGSMSDVAEYYRQWRQNQEEGAKADAGISESLQTALRAEIFRNVEEAKSRLQNDLDDALAREQELIDALSETDKKIQSLTDQLAETEEQANQDRQEAERLGAVRENQIENLTSRVQGLETERDQLIKAGEASRTEAAKAQMQLERADQAAAKAEQRVGDLQARLDEAYKAGSDAEKRAAVAEARAHELQEKAAELKEARKENDELEERLTETRAQLADAEKRAAVSEQRATDFLEKIEDLKGAVEKAKK